MVRIVSALLVAAVTCGALRVPGNRSTEVPKPGKAATNDTVVTDHSVTLKHAAAPTEAAVKVLRGHLNAIANNLEHMLQANGVMAGTKIGPELQLFLGELRKVLKETDSMKDTSAAMAKLDHAKEGIAQLTSDLTHRQVGIMKEEETQRDSLLLGVLMTKQKEPMADQLAILKSDNFKDLPVSKVLLAKHNTSEPLFAQAANYLDTHVAEGIRPHVEDRTARIQRTATQLESFAASMQKTFDIRSRSHEKHMKELAAAVKKAKGQKEQRTTKALEKREERNFKKWAVMQKRDIEAMRSAVEAVKKGDSKALEKAQAALKASVQQMQNKNAGFLVLIDMGHKLMARDCPYCVAQCVDKCHQEGQPYTACLTTCADAGEAK
jgi:hypothetical protein